MRIAAKSLTPGDELAQAVATILEQVGENPDREGLLDTPSRVAESLRYLTKGYADNPSTIVGDSIFAVEGYDDMVIVKDIAFFSLCEHHLLPFFGRVHIGYVPEGRVVGLSKLPRRVDVVVEGRHLCIEMRGVEKENSQTVTSCMLGVFRSDQRTRAEFLSHIQQSHSRSRQ